MIMLSELVIGPGDLVKTVVECLYNKFLLSDIRVFTKHFDSMSSCHSFSIVYHCSPPACP